MSREKRGSDDRRIISDMTFPREYSVNSYIYKNNVFGDEREHVLPTIDALVQDIISIGPGTYLSTLDVSRAYKNFKSDPLDWPLLVIKWSDKYYCDISMPFGGRASSYHMQRVADYIVRILKDKGVRAWMYLDDFILVSNSREQADQDIQQELGLPEARGKAPIARTALAGCIYKYLGHDSLCTQRPAGRGHLTGENLYEEALYEQEAVKKSCREIITCR